MYPKCKGVSVYSLYNLQSTPNIRKNITCYTLAMRPESFNSEQVVTTETAQSKIEDEDYVNAEFEDFGGQYVIGAKETTVAEADSREDFVNEEQLKDYHLRNEEVAGRLAEVEARINDLHEAEGDAAIAEPEEMEVLLDNLEQLQQEKVEASANYPGDWTGLLFGRMTDPLSKEKFVAQRVEAMEKMQVGEPDESERGNKYGKRYATHYQGQIDDYDQRLADIFAQTNIVVASESEKYKHGHGNIDQPGTVYINAESRSSGPLTSRQKNIIEAHEKGHGLRDFQSPIDKTEIQSVIDQAVLVEMMEERKSRERDNSKASPNYVRQPEEIIERMSQFKNYFGMKASEKFTSKHLEHIRKNYISDTGLDNGISDLLRVVTPETEKTFLKVINKYAI